jgi:hypothetical protein
MSILSFDPVVPVSRLTVTVHHRDDQDKAGFDGIEHSVGKDAGQTTPNIILEDPPAERSFGDLMDCLFDRGNETPSGILVRQPMVSGRIDEFREGFRMKLNPHPAAA